MRRVNPNSPLHPETEGSRMKDRRGCVLVVAFLVLVSFGALPAAAQQKPLPFRDPSLPIEQRVKDVVSRMTLEEKVSQMVNSAPAIERLGIPAYEWWNEGLHGVARAGIATVFPQAIGLGATWNDDLMHRVATVISDEARAKYHEALRQNRHAQYYGLTFWSPNINIFRDPRWGRGQETYGEDPYLTGQLGVAFVKGLQGDDPKYLKTVATPKHYAVHSGPESERHRFDAVVDERDLRETYLPAFQATVVDGKAWSVMCAYNRMDGKPCCASPRLLGDILRGEWRFNGYVTSDCGAVADIFLQHRVVSSMEAAAADAVKAGTELDCGDEYKALLGAVKQGLIGEREIDVAVGRLFEARIRLGMFDPDSMVPYAKIPFSVNDSESNRQLALTAARESIVLLKNEGNLLPLRKDVKTIAVVGPNAHQVSVLLGNYNGTPSRAVTPLDGIRKAVSASTKVLFAEGGGHTGVSYVAVPAASLSNPSGAGLKAEYFNNRELSGTPALARTDTQVDFDWATGSPAPEVNVDNFSVRWTGKLVAPASGRYRLGVRADDGVRVYLDGKLIAEDWTAHAPTDITGEVSLEAGRSYDLRVEYFEGAIGAVARLEWAPPQSEKQFANVAATAKDADVIVAVLGLSPDLEGEEMSVKIEGFAGGDRTDIGLPKQQQALLEALSATGKPVVVVLLNGSALGVTWAAAHVPAILEAWYPGEEGGTAIAETLFGDYNPAGRLPVTFYKSVDQLPPFEAYAMEGRTYRFFKGEPLYPFGYGLSYSKFVYSALKLNSTRIGAKDSLRVSVDVRNASDRAGDEVVEAYVTDLSASVRVPIRSLVGFERVPLAAGETRRVELAIAPRQLTLIDDKGRRVLEPGAFRVDVGGKQPGFKGSADAATTGTVSAQFEVTGTVTEIP
jgi:beta-glucosidase